LETPVSAFRARIGFALLSNPARPLPSTRVSVLNMLPHLREAGYETYIIHEPNEPTETPDLSGLADRVQALGLDIVYFQKIHGAGVRRQIAALRSAGVRTVYGVCDRVDNDLVRATDATVIVTDFLKHQHAPELWERIHVVHDGIERPELTHSFANEPLPNGRLRATLVTSSALDAVPVLESAARHRLEITMVGDYPQRATLFELRRRARAAMSASSLIPLLSRGFRAVRWHPQGVYDELRQADIGIIPVDTQPDPLPSGEVSWWQVKSENRLTLMMGLGLPVIASPVPSYLGVVEQGVNGYIARTPHDWLRAIDELRDPLRRHQVGASARASVLERFSKIEQASRLVRVLNRLLIRSPALA
jgi:glycosyltransferase involved in cell wall biosynthesis